MRTSQDGLDLIKQFEGCYLKAYLCPANVLTIGYGHTTVAGPPTVTDKMKITKAKAEEILADDLIGCEQDVDRLVKVDLTQHQFDVLVSFVFNCGAGALSKSTLLRRINASQFDKVPSELMKWTRGGGKELPGLVRRRRAEAALWRDLGNDKPQTAFREVPDEPVAPSIVSSKEANAAVIAGGASVIATASEVIPVIKQGTDVLPTLAGMFTQPITMVMVVVIVACIAIWFWRRSRLLDEG